MKLSMDFKILKISLFWPEENIFPLTGIQYHYSIPLSEDITLKSFNRLVILERIKPIFSMKTQRSLIQSCSADGMSVWTGALVPPCVYETAVLLGEIKSELSSDTCWQKTKGGSGTAALGFPVLCCLCANCSLRIKSVGLVIQLKMSPLTVADWP